jgi:hypothetical protein
MRSNARVASTFAICLAGCITYDAELATTRQALGGDGRIGQNPYDEPRLGRVLARHFISGDAWQAIQDDAAQDDLVTFRKLATAIYMVDGHPIATAIPLIAMTVDKALDPHVLSTWVLLVPPGELPNMSEVLQIGGGISDVGGLVICFNGQGFEVYDAGLGDTRTLAGRYLTDLEPGTRLTNDEYGLVTYGGVFPVSWAAGAAAPSSDAVSLPQCTDLGGQTFVPVRIFGTYAVDS